MGGHRGAAALKRMAPFALQTIGIGLGVGFVSAYAWYAYTQNNHKRWDALDRAEVIKNNARRKEFDSWLKQQPFDDEEVAKA